MSPTVCPCGEDLETPSERRAGACLICQLGELERERKAKAKPPRLALVDDAYRVAHPRCATCGAGLCDASLTCQCGPAPIYGPGGLDAWCSVGCREISQFQSEKDREQVGDETRESDSGHE